MTAPGAEVVKSEPTMTKSSGVVMGWAMRHDGQYGYVVFELELPMSIVERYCTRKHPPEIKAAAIGRIEHVALRLPVEGITKPKLSGNLFEEDES